VKEIHEALTTRQGLLGRNTSHVAGDGNVRSEWILSYAGRPEFAWRVDQADDRRVIWTCTRGPRDSVGTTAEYILTPLEDRRTRVFLTHAGWPHTGGNFTKCNTLWGGLLHHLKEFVESGNPRRPIREIIVRILDMASQQSLPDFVTQLEKTGFLVRVTDEKRVDEVPGVLEANPTKAILIEKIKDSHFSVLANAYSNQDMYAWAMECDKTQTDPLHAAAPPS
jgi:hypothetical protein